MDVETQAGKGRRRKGVLLIWHSQGRACNRRSGRNGRSKHGLENNLGGGEKEKSPFIKEPKPVSCANTLFWAMQQMSGLKGLFLWAPLAVSPPRTSGLTWLPMSCQSHPHSAFIALFWSLVQEEVTGCLIIEQECARYGSQARSVVEINRRINSH